MSDRTSFSPFHSAVNRIPVLRAKQLDRYGGAADLRELRNSLFADAPATGHHVLLPDRCSGTIDLILTVRTPLIFGEQTSSTNGTASTVSLPMKGGQLFVPPTMIKGMLSRAYETLTCSRFRVFGDHAEVLMYRSTGQKKEKKAFKASPQSLGTEQSALPLSSHDEASAADRLFGYVVQNPKSTATGGDVSARGHISFGEVDTSDAKISEKRLMLPPLLAPKPSSARRFLTSGDGMTPTAKYGETLPRQEFYSDGQLLGTAAYPIHRELLGKTGFPTSDEDHGSSQDNANVRMTVNGWVESGSVLRCSLRFGSLSSDELAALLWILDPQNLVPSEEQKDKKNTDARNRLYETSEHDENCGYLRMGIGKPLGLGAIKVEIAENGLKIQEHSSLAEAYETLDDCLGVHERCTSASAFTLPHIETLVKTPWVRAMQRAAFGYSDLVPVRYMTLEENQANNEVDPDGSPKPERGLSPRDLSDEHPEPLIVTKESTNEQNNRRHGRRKPQKRNGRRNTLNASKTKGRL